MTKYTHDQVQSEFAGSPMSIVSCRAHGHFSSRYRFSDASRAAVDIV